MGRYWRLRADRWSYMAKLNVEDLGFSSSTSVTTGPTLEVEGWGTRVSSDTSPLLSVVVNEIAK